MITLPAPPTDNLYKFVALFGLLIALGSGGAAFKLSVERENANRNAEARALTALREADRLSRSSAAGDREHAAAIADSVRRLADSVEAAADRLDERPSFVMPALLVAMVVGSAISAVGFVFWYQRFQRYQDQSIRRGASR